MFNGIQSAVCQSLISQVCWAFSYGFAQLEISLAFATLVLWLVYGAPLVRCIGWVIASGCFALGLLCIIGFALIRLKVQWMPQHVEAIKTYSPMVASLSYALVLTACQMLFHYAFARGGIRRTRHVLIALLFSNVMAAIIRARSIGSL